jgi:hypothetical protein
LMRKISPEQWIERYEAAFVKKWKYPYVWVVELNVL